MNIALIVAGGSGARMGQDVPKQFLCVDNKPIIIYTLERFNACEQIDKICVLCLRGWETVVEAYAKQFNIHKLAFVSTGGENRTLSIYNGLLALKEVAADDDIILISDANRPLISDDIIEDAIAKCTQYGAAVGVMPCYDSMYACTQKPLVSACLNRDEIYHGMGPETLRYKTAMTLIEQSVQEKQFGANTIGILLKNQLPVALSKSHSKYMKLTTVEDIEIFKALLKAEKYDWLK